MNFTEVNQCLSKIAAESSLNNKRFLIKEYVKDDLFRKVVLFALNPFQKYNIKKIEYTTLPRNESDNAYISLFEELERLSRKRGATKTERLRLSLLASAIGTDAVHIVNLILKKDLRCGAAAKLFKEYIPELPEFGVMLCGDSIKDFFRIINYDSNRILVSSKLDGVRTLCAVDITTNRVEYFSRRGHSLDFHIFDINILKIMNKIHKITGMTQIFLDGEVITKDMQFQNLMTQVKRLKDIDHTSFQYHIFDILDNRKLFDRLNFLSFIFKELHDSKEFILDDPSVNVFLLTHIPNSNLRTEEDVKVLTKKYLNAGLEGIVLKDTESHYKTKRCHNWTKVKPTKSIDVPITGHYLGEEGSKYENMMGGIIVDVDGVLVHVGSGFSDEDRGGNYTELFPVGELVEIEFQDYTKDKSLRNPVFKRIRGDK